MRNRVRYVVVPLTVALLATVTFVTTSVAADHTTLPAIVPTTTTPNINDDAKGLNAVKAITRIGTEIVVGGVFQSATNPKSSTSITRSNLLAFDATTGVIDTGFAPTLDGEVDSLLPGPTAGTVYVGGGFSTVDGAAHTKLVELNLSDGSVVTGFAPNALNGFVNSIEISGGRLFIGGTFTTVGKVAHGGLATLNPTTGATDAFMNIQVAGHHNYTGVAGTADSGVGVDRFDISPDGTKMVAIGNFKTANGTSHDQILMANVTSTNSSATLLPFFDSEFTPACKNTSFDEWVRSVAFSPDGSYFVVVATGGWSPGTICDSASRYETSMSGNSNAHSTWVDHSGADTFLSVATTSTAIYVGGHFRWLNNSFGPNIASAGAVGRASIAALDPQTGLPMAWNPGRNPRGFGIQALYVDDNGVYVGSDTDFIGYAQYVRQKIALLPFAGGYTPAAGQVVSTLPAKIYQPSTSGISYRTFSGTSGGSLTSAVGNSDNTPWQNERGAFLVDNVLYYGLTDGNLYKRTFDGSTLGTVSPVNPYHDPFWDTKTTGSDTSTYAGVKSGFYAEIPGLSSMYYDGKGHLYYTRTGQTALYWRWFAPDSGVIGADEFTATGATGFSTAQGSLFIAGSSLYYSTSDGNMHKIGWTGTTTSGSASTVSGPSVDGINWATRGSFIGN